MYDVKAFFLYLVEIFALLLRISTSGAAVLLKRSDGMDLYSQSLDIDSRE